MQQVMASKKPLRTRADSCLIFEYYISIIHEKSSQKLHALSSVAKYMYHNELSSIMRAFITF